MYDIDFSNNRIKWHKFCLKFIVMKKSIFILVQFFVIIYCFNSYAEIFKWVDEKAIIHYTDDYSKIPKKYINSIENIEFFDKDDSSNNTSKDLPLDKVKSKEEKDILGRDRQYWRSRAEELRNRIRKLQELIEILRIKYNELTEKYNDSKSNIERFHIRQDRDSVKSEMDNIKREIEDLRIKLEKKLPEEVELYKAKKEWID